MRAAAPAGTPWPSRNSRTARSARCSSHDRTAAAIRASPDPRRVPRVADAGGGAERPVRVAVDLVEDRLDPVAVDEPRGAADANVLDRVQVGEHRRLALRLADPDALDGELRPVLRMAAPIARDVDRLARVHVRERARQDDLLALVADAREHGEVALVEGVANGGDLDRQLRHSAAR